MEDTKLDLKELVMRSDEIEGNIKGYRPGNEKYEQNLIKVVNIIRDIILDNQYNMESFIQQIENCKYIQDTRYHELYKSLLLKFVFSNGFSRDYK